MRDNVLIGDGIRQDLNETEPGQGDAAPNFFTEQNDRFLGGATETKRGSAIFSLSSADIHPGGLVIEKRTALLDQSKKLLETAEFQELGTKYQLLRRFPDQPDIQTKVVSHFSEYVIENLEQTLAEMSMSDALPDLAIAIDKGRINASEITASELLKLHIFALGVRDSLDEVTEIATDVDGIGTMQRRFPRKYLKVGLALEQGDEIANLVPYYSVIREGLREESFEGVEERANEILKYTQKTAGEMFNAGKIPQRF